MSTATESGLVAVNPGALDQPGARGISDVLHVKARVAEILQRVMKGPDEKNKNGIHYGPAFPGSTGKHTLKLPGAQTLCSTFGLSPKLEVEDLSDPSASRFRYRVKVRMYTRSGLFLGEGIGECSTDEDKYQWEAAINEKHWQLVKADRPEDTRVKYRKDARNPDGFETALQVRANTADKANTVLKIGKKRGLVDATILVLDCSDLFDQDLEELIEDIHDVDGTEPQERTERKPKPEPTVKLPNFGQSAGQPLAQVSSESLTWYHGAIANSLGKPGKEQWAERDKALLRAIEGELAKRNTEPKPEPTKDTGKTDAPKTPKLADQAWEAFVGEFATSHPDLFNAVKDEFKADTAKAVKKADRERFLERFQELLNRG